MGLVISSEEKMGDQDIERMYIILRAHGFSRIVRRKGKLDHLLQDKFHNQVRLERYERLHHWMKLGVYKIIQECLEMRQKLYV
ncbi:hypothetical protein HPP92_001117 [Vanilla planifolia]|uniref:Uncharacterized protein n=1 Tax=Vanilla planifolia TaxID=51239 RepID=A0A835RXL0_VANPL|nr:hypothetical protein HPP92_001117 [Vanilla planifolia]